IGGFGAIGGSNRIVTTPAGPGQRRAPRKLIGQLSGVLLGSVAPQMLHRVGYLAMHPHLSGRIQLSIERVPDERVREIVGVALDRTANQLSSQRFIESARRRIVVEPSSSGRELEVKSAV